MRDRIDPARDIHRVSAEGCRPRVAPVEGRVDHRVPGGLSDVDVVVRHRELARVLGRGSGRADHGERIDRHAPLRQLDHCGRRTVGVRDERDERLGSGAHGLDPLDGIAEDVGALIGTRQRGDVEDARGRVSDPGDGRRSLSLVRRVGFRQDFQPPGLLGVEILRDSRPVIHLPLNGEEHPGNQIADVVGGREISDDHGSSRVPRRIEGQKLANRIFLCRLQRSLDLSENLEVVPLTHDLAATDARRERTLRIGDGCREEHPIGGIPNRERNAVQVADELRGGCRERLLLRCCQAAPHRGDHRRLRRAGEKPRDARRVRFGERSELVRRQQPELFEQLGAGQLRQQPQFDRRDLYPNGARGDRHSLTAGRRRISGVGGEGAVSGGDGDGGCRGVGEHSRCEIEDRHPELRGRRIRRPGSEKGGIDGLHDRCGGRTDFVHNESLCHATEGDRGYRC